MTTITSKYGFKVSVNQFGQSVSEDYFDISEQILINRFEEYTLDLKIENRSNYTMIELGSNQAYYSLLFKYIIGIEKTINIMVEPFMEHMLRGMHHFKLNNVNGHFINKCIAPNWVAHGISFDEEITTIKELLDNHNIKKLDVLHCDIDGSELEMLIANSDVFDSQTVKYIFLLTHSTDLHTKCKSFLLEKNYKLLLDHDTPDVGFDRLLIFKCNN